MVADEPEVDSVSIELDDLDREILRRLSADGRASSRDIANDIKLSLTPTLRRIKRLEDLGIITGYAASLDEKKLGAKLSTFVFVSLQNKNVRSMAEFERSVVKLPEVMSCDLLVGEYDYIVRVATRDMEHYHRFLVDSLMRIPGLSLVKTNFTLKVVYNRPFVMI